MVPHPYNLNAGDTYRRIVAAIKPVIDVQTYVLNKHIESGVFQGFPAVVIASLGFSSPVDEWCHTEVFTLKRQTPDEAMYEYLYLLRKQMEDRCYAQYAAIKRTGKHAPPTLPTWHQEAQTWREYVDSLFEKSIEYIGQ